MTIDRKKVIANAPYVIFFWMGDKLGYALRVYEGNQLSALMKGIAELFHAPFFSFNPLDMLIGAGAAVAIKGILYIRSKNAKKYRKGVEYGSARWSA